MKKATNKKKESKMNLDKKVLNGFTLIELLAVIIILGILMIIAIPSVTKYISESRKSAYVNTAKEIIGGARNLVNGGKLEMYNTDTTYYIDYKCIKTENSLKSPYGEFIKAYVAVTYTGNNYEYFWISVDETGQGVRNITKESELIEDVIVPNIDEDEIEANIALENTSTITLIDANCNKKDEEQPVHYSSSTGETSFTLTYDNQGGTGCTSQVGEYKKTWGTLCTPTRTDNYTFEGWFTQPNGAGDEVTSSLIVNGNTIAYAKWEQQTKDAAQILSTAQAAGQVNQIPNTNIYIFKGGTKKPPANYVKFNNETWRIIGIYGEQLKIIRVNSSGAPSAPNKFVSVKYSYNTANYGYGSSKVAYDLNSTYYNTLSTTAKNMIDVNGVWNIGISLTSATASVAYSGATTTSSTTSTPIATFSTPWRGKVGLIATYEYLYASSGEGCQSVAGSSFQASCGKAEYNWLKPSGTYYLWTVNSDKRNSGNVLILYNNSFVGNYGSGNAMGDAVPAVYLKSSVTFSSGNGTSPSNAYVLQLN